MSVSRANFVALCVGVSANPADSLLADEQPIRHASQDARDVAAFLKEAFGSSGKVICLRDEEASPSLIRRAVSAIRDTKPELFVFYFSGHGRFSEGGQKGLVAFGHSAVDALLSIEDCAQAIGAPAAKRSLAIVDACHAAAILGATGFFSSLGDDRARTYLAASDAVAFENRRLPNSIFTTALLTALATVRDSDRVDVEGTLFNVVSRDTAAGSLAVRNEEQAVVRGGVAREPIYLPLTPNASARYRIDLTKITIRRHALRYVAALLVVAIATSALTFSSTYHLVFNGRGNIEAVYGLRELGFVSLGIAIQRAETTFSDRQIKDDVLLRRRLGNGEVDGIWGASRPGVLPEWALNFVDVSHGLPYPYFARRWAIKQGAPARTDDPFDLQVLASVLASGEPVSKELISLGLQRLPPSADCGNGDAATLDSAAKLATDTPYFEGPLQDTRLFARLMRAKNGSADLLLSILDRVATYDVAWGLGANVPSAILPLAEANVASPPQTNGTQGLSLVTYPHWFAGACGSWIRLAAAPRLQHVDQAIEMLRELGQTTAGRDRSARIASFLAALVRNGTAFGVGSDAKSNAEALDQLATAFESRDVMLEFFREVSGHESDQLIESLIGAYDARRTNFDNAMMLALAIQLVLSGEQKLIEKFVPKIADRIAQFYKLAGSDEENRALGLLARLNDPALALDLTTRLRANPLFPVDGYSYQEVYLASSLLSFQLSTTPLDPRGDIVLDVAEKILERREARMDLSIRKDISAAGRYNSVLEALEINETGRDLPDVPAALVFLLAKRSGVDFDDADPILVFSSMRGDANYRRLVSYIWGTWIARERASSAAAQRNRLAAKWRESADPLVREALADTIWRSLEPIP
ncbi:caspase family protein [Rhizobium sp. LjRoot258]|uniref:caspase family protein n=1 Tax=Rhizobium sp. LjRoot258 TaxID=3342299 RepID=UPI003ECEAA1D